MHDLVQFLSTVLPIIASSLLILVISINLYVKIRRKFPIKVNCWFCNTWTKVNYDDRNSFDCPTCLQYNGFTKDGDYNKIIPEQHDELMNKSSRVKNGKSIVTNGLCALCNNNQRLKIVQLAHFVPLVEENYDVEIEHFQKQLEKAYKLCKKCDSVLKKTLQKQTALLFGNRIKNMCNSGISKVVDQFYKDSRKTLFSGLVTVILVFLLIFVTVFSMKILTKYFSAHIPPTYLPLYNDVISMVSYSKMITFEYFNKSVKIEPYFVISLCGFFYQTLRIIFGKSYTATSVNQLLCWVILTLISWVRFNRHFQTYILVVGAFTCLYLLTTAFSTNVTKVRKIPGKTMRKLVKNLEYTCTDTSSDFENVSISTSDYLNNTATSDTTNVLSRSDNSDLNKSLNNLHLSFKSPSSFVSCSVKRPKPVLSPSKLQNVNSWVAGGFWRDSDGVILPQRSNVSRSSSESSGFGSQHNDQFVPFDRVSLVNSEYTRLSPSYFPSTALKSHTFYPNLQQNNMLLINRVGSPNLIKFNESNYNQRFENWSDRINSQATQSFRDLNLHSNHN